ncbi:MAG: PEP/pyruvate-binding domain-containing protein [Candidatus Kapaibacterium sp.]
MADLPSVGGKNASLGGMMNALTSAGVRVPDGFAVTVQAYRDTLDAGRLPDHLGASLAMLDVSALSNLTQVSERCRSLILEAPFPESVREAITRAYHAMRTDTLDTLVAVRSSATAEDLPTASFAGQHDSFLNVSGVDDLLAAVKNCYASVFNARAIKYRIDNGVDHLKLGLSVGVQRMVRTDLGSAGVAFTIDPESGSRNVVYLTSTWGSGELIVQGAVVPDELVLFTPSLRSQRSSILRRRRGSSRPLTDSSSRVLSISDNDAETLGRWCCAIEDHYGMPMDVE